MSRYGYNHHQSHQYRVRSENIKVDLEAKVLRITATHDGWGHPPIVEEFPMVLVRSCSKCGKPVSIYAQGSLKSLRLQTGRTLFGAPWMHGHWAALEQEGSFALVAHRNHDGTDSWASGCPLDRLKVTFSAA